MFRFFLLIALATLINAAGYAQQPSNEKKAEAVVPAAVKLTNLDPSFREVMIEELTQIAQHEILDNFETALLTTISYSNKHKRIVLLFDTNEGDTTQTMVVLNHLGGLASL